MTVDEIQKGAFYKIKNCNIVYRVVELYCPGRGWADVVIFNKEGRYYARKSLDLIELAKMIEMRVKPK